jgi:hypothetical protein
MLLFFVLLVLSSSSSLLLSFSLLQVAQADHITQTNSLQTHIKSLEVRTVRTRVSFFLFLLTFTSPNSFSSTYSVLTPSLPSYLSLFHLSDFYSILAG